MRRHGINLIMSWCPITIPQVFPDTLFKRNFTQGNEEIAEKRRPAHVERLCSAIHYDVIKWKYFPRYWPFVRGIHRPPVDSPHKGPCRRALIFCLVRAWTNGWANAGDLRLPLRSLWRHCNAKSIDILRQNIGRFDSIGHIIRLNSSKMFNWLIDMH